MDPLGELPLNRKRRTAEDDLGEGREHQLKPMSDRNPKCKCFIKSSLFFGPRQTVCYCHSLPEDTDLAPRIFFKFKDLPVNIRLKIWQHSWGPRDVGVVRCILGTQDTALQECDNFLFPQTFSGDRDLRIKHVQIAKHHWGVPPYSENNSKEFMSMKYQYSMYIRYSYLYTSTASLLAYFQGYINLKDTLTNSCYSRNHHERALLPTRKSAGQP